MDWFRGFVSSCLRAKMDLLFVWVIALLAATTMPAQAQQPNLPRARELFRQHRYAEAQAIVDRVLSRHPNHREALLERGHLLIRQWRLGAADSIASLLKPGTAGVLLHGRVALLQKKYDDALRAAREAQRIDARDAEAYLLEAEVHFWKEKPELAEAPLKRALELDSLNADARFAYGYQIWRRVDARQLPEMARQWNAALAIDSLHYITHWHYGNGHTNLTYADYAQPTDSAVRVALRGADSLVARERLAEAIERTRQIERQYPESLLPALTRGSIFYMAYPMPRAERLDSAQATFLALLHRKKNYGPAHNGLAAVIKQRQLEYVANYDSLEAAIAAEPLPADSPFTRVFKDLAYFPGDRVERMARQQLGPSLAYLPFLARLGFTYTVPPLHRDLTDALNNPFFRTGTTFDNRQWMDIRGAGGNHAAASIEYVERGSHQERVVLLHEYVHQWHGAVLTDSEVRRIRELYHLAMANSRTLDYYASNNESEFFAQSYEAYLTPVKVHPLNHKAMNTRSDLIAKDPELFAFLDTLITRNRVQLAGDTMAMRSNWAHVYAMLARRNRRNVPLAQAQLDSAFRFDARYVPAHLEQAALYQAQNRWAEADAAITRALSIDSAYAPAYAARAVLATAIANADRAVPPLEPVMQSYRAALLREKDLAERARLNQTMRTLYADYAMINEAIAIADEYVKTAPTPSTYLRDRRNEAAAFAADLRSRIGKAREVTTFFMDYVAQNPQNYEARALAAQALLRAGRAEDAEKMVADGQRILAANRQARADYTVIMAAAVFAQRDTARARTLALSVDSTGRAALREPIRMMLAATLIRLGDVSAGLALVPDDTTALVPAVHAERLYVRALADWARRDQAAAMSKLRRAIGINVYHAEARAMAHAIDSAN